MGGISVFCGLDVAFLVIFAFCLFFFSYTISFLCHFELHILASAKNKAEIHLSQVCSIILLIKWFGSLCTSLMQPCASLRLMVLIWMSYCSEWIIRWQINPPAKTMTLQDSLFKNTQTHTCLCTYTNECIYVSMLIHTFMHINPHTCGKTNVWNQSKMKCS